MVIEEGTKGGEKAWIFRFSEPWYWAYFGWNVAERKIRISADIIILLSSNGGLVMAWSAPFFLPVSVCESYRTALMWSVSEFLPSFIPENRTVKSWRNKPFFGYFVSSRRRLKSRSFSSIILCAFFLRCRNIPNPKLKNRNFFFSSVRCPGPKINLFSAA